MGKTKKLTIMRRIGTAAAALAVGLGISLAGTTAAYAGDARCAYVNDFDSCGHIVSMPASTINVTIATNFNGTAPSSSAIKRTIAPGKSSNIHKDANGYYYDWDTFWVPAKYCAKIRAGVGHAFISYNDRRNKSTGAWHKVDNLGATIVVAKTCV